MKLRTWEDNFVFLVNFRSNIVVVCRVVDGWILRMGGANREEIRFL